MPASDVVQDFTTNAESALAGPISAYYNVLEKYGVDDVRTTAAQSLARLDLQRALRSIHTQAALIGGGDALSDDAQSLLNDIMAQDEDYLDNFVDALPSLSRDQALFRSSLYVGTARNTMNDILSLELPTLPVYPKDKQLFCGQWCTCLLRPVFLYGKGNFDVYWDLDPDVKEACDDCIRLSQTWNPLRIRGGKLQAVKEVSQHDIQHIRALLYIALGKVA